MYIIGEVRIFFGEVPKGFLKCDGRVVPIEKYKKLYHEIYRNFWEDTVSYGEFKLPDLRVIFGTNSFIYTGVLE